LSGDQVSISGVLGNTDANGIFFITVLDANTFSLDGSSGNGDWIPNAAAMWVLLDGTGAPAEDFSQFISDPALVRCVKEALGLTDADPLTEGQVVATTQLDCSCRNDTAITNIEGLRFFVNLDFLSLANNLVSDILPVAGLTELTDLRLSGNLIIDVTDDNPLASLTALTTLDLSDNQIRDSNAFSTLQNIDFLSLANNDICEITSLVALTELGPDSGINAGDTIILDGNHLNNSQGLNDIAQLETSGAFISFNNIDGPCPTRRILELANWPTWDVREFTELLNLRAPCN
jgi:hypothetical protein